MLQQNMSAALRHNFGKGATHRLRQSGYAPAIMYGKKSEPVALSMEAKTLTKDLLRLHGHNVIVSLEIEGEEVTDSKHLVELLAKHSPGDEIEIVILRDDEMIRLELMLAEHPDDSTKGYLGIYISPHLQKQEPFLDQQNS